MYLPHRSIRSHVTTGWLYVLMACLLLSAADTSSAQKKGPEHAEEIRALVRESIDPKGPGVAVLVSHNGTPVYLGGFGLADVAAGTKITPNSTFDLASVSKHMTAVAILTLQEKGKLHLEDPLSKLLVDYRVPAKGREVTVNDLLHHISGLRDYTDDDDWTGTDEEFDALTPSTHLKWLNTTVPRRPPGVKYEYNNTEYVLLSLIVERLTGESYLSYARDTLFLPAGMKATTILDGSTALPPTRVTGYAATKKGKVTKSFHPTVITGDGNVYTSVRELALWDAALRRNTLIKSETQKAAWTNGKYDNGKPIRGDDGDGYGMGWFVSKDRPIVYHSGSWDGTSTYLLMDFQSGYTVAVLSNDENMEAGTLAESIYSVFQP